MNWHFVGELHHGVILQNLACDSIFSYLAWGFSLDDLHKNRVFILTLKHDEIGSLIPIFVNVLKNMWKISEIDNNLVLGCAVVVIGESWGPGGTQVSPNSRTHLKL